MQRVLKAADKSFGQMTATHYARVGTGDMSAMEVHPNVENIQARWGAVTVDTEFPDHGGGMERFVTGFVRVAKTEFNGRRPVYGDRIREADEKAPWFTVAGVTTSPQDPEYRLRITAPES